jgi:putative protease
MQMRKNVELLAPAGSIESLYAAVLNGADAVYMGGSRFSARAYASNFDSNTLKEALDYCHVYGVKVYITVNTLIKEEEILDLLEYIEFLYEIGVDGLIVQDIGISGLIGYLFKDIEIHASTQMTVHNIEGALFLKQLGFKRIVLSRELSLQEIEEISKKHKIETEIFVHGALCICYSGQCLMSSLIGGRSGNRGRCAQPCRLPYTLVNSTSQEEKTGYLLSPKDMCTIEDVEDIINTGTSSLKIEGRMKRPEYVAGVVSSYRKAIDNLGEKASGFKWEQENKKLLKLFNREGFSKAYLYGNVGKDMMAYNNPKNTGLFVGTAERDNTILLKENISIGDGISFGEDGFTVSKIVREGEEVSEGRFGERVRLYPTKYKYRDILYKTSDSNLLSELGESYKNLYKLKINLNVEIQFKVGSPILIITEYNGRNYKVEGDIIQVAKNKPLNRERIEESLRKTGDTPFLIGNIDFTIFQDGFIAISSINSLRRNLIDEILEHEKDKHRRKLANRMDFRKNYDLFIGKNTLDEKSDIPEFIVCVSNKEQLRAAEELECKHIAIDILKRNIKFNLDEIKVPNIYLKVPNIIRKEFNFICNYITENLGSIKGIITSNYGVISKFSGMTTIIGDYKLNVFNSASAKVLNEYLDMVPLSLELNKKEVSSIVKKANAPTQMLIYGKAELMISEYCAAGSVYGNKSLNNACSEPCKKEKFYLRDRKGEEFIVRNDIFCRSYIYNNVPINLIPHKKETDKMGVSSYRLDFIDEDYEETLRILRGFLEGEEHFDNVKYTRGHFRRGVE